MPLESGSSGHVLVDVLDRVLDKGIVIDAAVRISVVGIELLGVDARVVVASIETYLLHADTLAYTDLAAGPRRGPVLPPADSEGGSALPAAPAALIAPVPTEVTPPPPLLYAEPADPERPSPEPERVSPEPERPSPEQERLAPEQERLAAEPERLAPEPEPESDGRLAASPRQGDAREGDANRDVSESPPDTSVPADDS
jgi:gas vesicle structural protein